jgi:nucleoside-triphosphatase THEP1
LRIENCSQTVLLTGRRGVGKTTVCQAVAELARRRGYRPGGVITPALYACPEPRRRACPADWELGIGNWELTKVGFEALDVGSGQRWPLARTDQELGGPQVGPYSLDPTALARALEVLKRAATAGYDLFMVDEIGPLELEQGEGFAPILDLLPVKGPTNTLIVVRPALLDPLRLRLRDTESAVFSVTEENRDELPLRIVEKLWE